MAGKRTEGGVSQPRLASSLRPGDPRDSHTPSDGGPVAGEGPESLRSELRSVARSRIVLGAAKVISEKGLRATADDIADAAGVGRRTLFRHFSTHGEVLAAGISHVLTEYQSRLPGPPQPNQSLEDWLYATATALHSLHRELMGQLFWDIWRPDFPGTPNEVAVMVPTIVEHRRQLASTLAVYAWESAGGGDRPPEWLTDVFVLSGSGFATHALPSHSPAEAASVTTRILLSVLESARDEPGSSRRRATPGSGS